MGSKKRVLNATSALGFKKMTALFSVNWQSLGEKGLKEKFTNGVLCIFYLLLFRHYL